MNGKVKLNSRIGEVFITNEGYKIEIIEYNNCDDLVIEFQDKYKTRIPARYRHCKTGKIRNPNHPSVLGVGRLGIGDYKCSINGKTTVFYDLWNGVLQRGFDLKFKAKHPTYNEVIVNAECFCFQDFAEWLDDNWYDIEGERMEVDKDILIKGNKEYRFDRMILVPQRINTLFVKSDAIRGDYPIGVSYNKNTNKYQAKCKVDGKTKYLGCYDTSEKAFEVYKQFKETYIKKVADEYKDKIPKKLYDAMYVYEIDIND